MKSLFILEDDKVLSDLLKRYLESHLYKVEISNHGSTALNILQNDNFDIILLDITVPGISGLDILTQLRAEENLTPVVMITGNTDEENEIHCFEKGTNLFHKKPVNTRLLLSQIKSLSDINNADLGMYSVGNIVIDDTQKSVYINNQYLSLTKGEYSTLLYLVKRKNKITTKEQIIDNLYKSDNEVLEATIDTSISRLRKKLTTAGVPKELIETKRGFGYMVKDD